ncbi:MAG: sulfotransferase family 2 domain-containing protein [Gammaproteobacteria bacterium]
MIISHKHRFIFFAVPRTATHAVREALRPHLDENDWEQKILHGESSIPIPEIAALKHGHISFRQIESYLSREVRDSYFKFAFVRNPFDRFISACFFLNRKNPDFRGREIITIKQLFQRDAFRRRMLILPQYQFLIDNADQIAMDYIGRYETLQESWNEICTHIGIKPEKLPEKNVSEHARYSDYYDTELKEAIEKFYSKDLELFRYAWQNGATG